MFLIEFQEDRTRVEIFHEHANRKKESAWSPFLNLLNRQDGFIVNMAARILAKLACWGHEPMPKSDLHFYLQWLKDQLTLHVSFNNSVFFLLRILPFLLVFYITNLILPKMFKFIYDRKKFARIRTIFIISQSVRLTLIIARQNCN